MSDSLKQAVEAMEVAWRRLREVLDGPDVAAALVERQAVRPMSAAPRDGTPITLHHVWGDRIQALYHDGYRGWVDRQNNLLREEGEFVGWSPVTQKINPMSTAPRDGTEVNLHFDDGRYVKAEFHKENGFWMDRHMCEPAGTLIGWSPVK